MSRSIINVKLKRTDASVSWGFRLHGGVEFGAPLSIQKVNEDSVAAQSGIFAGDAIFSINGTSTENMRHKDAQVLISQTGNSLEMLLHRGDNHANENSTSTSLERKISLDSEAKPAYGEELNYVNNSVSATMVPQRKLSNSSILAPKPFVPSKASVNAKIASMAISNTNDSVPAPNVARSVSLSIRQPSLPSASNSNRTSSGSANDPADSTVSRKIAHGLTSQGLAHQPFEPINDPTISMNGIYPAANLAACPESDFPSAENIAIPANDASVISFPPKSDDIPLASYLMNSHSAASAAKKLGGRIRSNHLPTGKPHHSFEEYKDEEVAHPAPHVMSPVYEEKTIVEERPMKTVSDGDEGGTTAVNQPWRRDSASSVSATNQSRSFKLLEAMIDSGAEVTGLAFVNQRKMSAGPLTSGYVALPSHGGVERRSSVASSCSSRSSSITEEREPTNDLFPASTLNACSRPEETVVENARKTIRVPSIKMTSRYPSGSSPNQSIANGPDKYTASGYNQLAGNGSDHTAMNGKQKPAQSKILEQIERQLDETRPSGSRPTIQPKVKPFIPTNPALNSGKPTIRQKPGPSKPWQPKALSGSIEPKIGKATDVRIVQATTNGSNGTDADIGSSVPICCACGSAIKGPYSIALGKTWCTQHFVCTNPNCQTPLTDVGFVLEGDEVYCERDYQLYFAPHCGQCGKSITGESVSAVGMKYHPHCFVCAHCHQPIGGSTFHLQDGRPYCEKDWMTMFQTKCRACNFEIDPSDRWVEALDADWHSECFKCSTCRVKLEGESFYARDGLAMCKRHSPNTHK